MDHDNAGQMAGWLTRFSLERRVTVFVILLGMIVVGWISMVGIPLEMLPRGFEFPGMNVSVPWRDSPAREILEKIGLPLEEELSTVQGVDGINTWCGRGNCNISLRFKQGTDMDVAYREVRDRVERARLLFPEDVERVFINKMDMSGIPLTAVGLMIDPSLGDYYDLVQKEVLLPLSRIDGVANVTSQGLRENEIIIEVDKQKADAHGLNIYQLSQELGGDNFSMASGTVREPGKKYLLRSVSKFESVEQLENRRLTDKIRLKDVATVSYEPPDREFAVRVNGRPALALIAHKEGDANTVEVSRRISQTLIDMKKNPRLAGMEMHAFFDQGRVIEESLGGLIDNGKVGGLFAALILYVFLRQFRLTIIIALSIPLCLLLALVVMYFWGESLNILTILGLVICVGLLVDNSVVVAENILRLQQEGYSRREASIKGASEIALAITLATLTTVVVFLPSSLVEGEGKFFLLRLSIPICVSLLASLFVALMFIPLSVYLTTPEKKADELPKKGWWGSRLVDGIHAVTAVIYEWVFGNMRRGYHRLLAVALKHRLEVVLALVILFVLTIKVAWDEVDIAETQKEDQMTFSISVQMSKEYNFEETSAWFEEAEQILMQHTNEYVMSGFMVMNRRNGGNIEGWMDKENKDRPYTAKEVGSLIYKALPKKAGVTLYYSEESRGKEGSGDATHQIMLQGDDPDILEEVAEQLEPIFTSMDGVLGMRKGEDTTPNELALIVDSERAQAAGVNPRTLAGVVGYALRGSTLPRFNDKGRQIPVRVRFEEEDRDSLIALSDFWVPTENGNVLPVDALTDVKLLNSARGISRRDRRVGRSITLELEDGSEKQKQTRENLIALQGLIELPEGVQFGRIQPRVKTEDLDSMKFAGIMSVIFIYLLMGFLFESFVLPLSVILTIPLAALGVIWIHYITGKDMDMLGIVGIVLLIGVVVNNGIVLIDYVNRLRAGGMERGKALLTAADRRFRPIVMTASTTIIGMLPLTVSEPSEIGMSYKSFGLTLIGGMTTATMLTLLVIPVFYTFFDDARNAFMRSLSRGVGSKRGKRLSDNGPDGVDAGLGKI
ncbi:efflux RND transporter permease subunit [Verrucomicrobia bacterium]|nr:efflux RND transporter permease subunit [Verrucomicrobiota bacterium]